jgi:hypothetical protein
VPLVFLIQLQANTTITESTVNIASMSRTGTTVTVNFSSEHNLASGITVQLLVQLQLISMLLALE